MKRIFARLAIGAFLLPAAAGAQDKLEFSTAVDFAYKQLALTLVAGPATNELKPSLSTLSLSPTLAWRGFFLSGAVERTLGEGSTAGIVTNSDGTRFWADRRVRREENYLTLGYNIWGGFSLFGGYLHNSTTTYGNNLAFDLTFDQGVRTTYTERGPFYGLGYSYSFTKGTVLGASVALANAKGTFDQENSAQPFTTSEGDVRGTSYSLFLSGPLTGSLYYRLGYKATRYDFDFVTAGINRSTKQNYDAFVIGVANRF